MYWTEADNAASQALAKGLGYWQFGQEIDYRWRKPAGPPGNAPSEGEPGG